MHPAQPALRLQRRADSSGRHLLGAVGGKLVGACAARAGSDFIAVAALHTCLVQEILSRCGRALQPRARQGDIGREAGLQRTFGAHGIWDGVHLRVATGLVIGEDQHEDSFGKIFDDLGGRAIVFEMGHGTAVRDAQIQTLFGGGNQALDGERACAGLARTTQAGGR